MMRFVLWLSVLFGTFLARVQAQSWVTATVPGYVLNIQQFYANDTRDTIYCAGAIGLDGTSNFGPTNPVMRYANGQWDTLSVLQGQIFSMVLYHDTLIAGGNFNEASGTPCQGIAYHDGVQWQPYGELEYGVRQLRVLDDTLYAVGGFDLADGQPAPGVAKRVGNSWQPVGWFTNQGSIIDVTKFNGNLVVIGNVSIDGGRGIAQWNGSAWHLIGPGILGGFSGGQCLTVYQDQLYVGGQIDITAGNAGQNIMRWDGEQFHPLGQGVQQWLGNTSSIATVFNMVEHDGLLFVGGGFRAAGGVEAMGLATWDGTEWCGVPGNFQATGGIPAMDFYQDTLFAACGAMLDGDSVNRAVKFVGDAYQAACSGPVGIQAFTTRPEPILLPNPAGESVSVNCTLSGTAWLSVHDAQGKLLYRQQLRGTGCSLVQLDVSTWSAGIYALTLQEQGAPTWSSRLIVER